MQNTHGQPDRLFTARLEDMVSRCERSGFCVCSHFLDERQCAEAELWCRRNTGGLLYALWGGYESARRKMLVIYPDYCSDQYMESFPMKCLTFTFRKEDDLTHRDFLGSFMGLRLKREVIGDIIVDKGVAQAFVTDVAAGDILTSVSKIGRVGVKVSDDRPFELDTEQAFQEIGGTAASLRLDCIVALAANVSRENAAKLIRSEKVDVNHFTVTSVSQELHEGDILSVRGSGRFIFAGSSGTTRSGRLHILLRKFI